MFGSFTTNVQAPGYDPNAQNNLIAQQFGQAKQSLQYQQNQALGQANQAVDRNTAISGASGGTALKEKENASNSVNQGFAAQGNQLNSEEAAAQQQAGQFAATYGLQNAQFQASQNQFGQQMAEQYAEFGENQKTNLINAVTALKSWNVDE